MIRSRYFVVQCLLVDNTNKGGIVYSGKFKTGQHYLGMVILKL